MITSPSKTTGWVEEQLSDSRLTHSDYEQIASELGREGNMKALIYLHNELCKRGHFNSTNL